MLMRAPGDEHAPDCRAEIKVEPTSKRTQGQGLPPRLLPRGSQGPTGIRELAAESYK
ncbi:MAG: hypothetical protein CM15mP120_21280 [Pseudomonadota bacterium]|nr:MAG: hypothetical protein CM15mP120_21280 [Pseudomonadota bacterium]